MHAEKENGINKQREASRRTRLLASTRLVLKAALRSFGVNRNLEIAATLAFYGFLSLMPLLLMTVVGLGRILRSSDAVFAALAHVMSDLFPSINTELLSDIATISGGGALGILSVLLLLWSMTPFAGALRSAMARIFKTSVQTPFFKGKLIDLAAVLSLLMLFMLLALFKVFAPAVSAGIPSSFRWLSGFVGSLLPFLFSVGFLGLFFRVFSPVRLNWRQWLLGAVSVTILWTLMRHAFVMFMQFNPEYGYAFGSLKTIFILIVWVYYSFAALLLGAEIMANTYRRDALLLRGLLNNAGAPSAASRSLVTKFEVRLAEGDVLFREGEAGQEMFVVLEGRILLSRGGQSLAEMEPGQYFGEMSLLGGAPRSATAAAVGDTRLATINRGNFDLLVRENPALVRDLLEELARRLDKTNRRLYGDASPDANRGGESE